MLNGPAWMVMSQMWWCRSNQQVTCASLARSRYLLTRSTFSLAYALRASDESRFRNVYEICIGLSLLEVMLSQQRTHEFPPAGNAESTASRWEGIYAARKSPSARAKHSAHSATIGKWING